MIRTPLLILLYANNTVVRKPAAANQDDDDIPIKEIGRKMTEEYVNSPPSLAL